MVIKYNGNIEETSIDMELKKITNQIYSLLPKREEELVGMCDILFLQHDILFPLVCKLEGLYGLSREEEFMRYRATIFECLGLIGELRKRCQD